jgi:hypothetical protein
VGDDGVMNGTTVVDPCSWLVISSKTGVGFYMTGGSSIIVITEMMREWGNGVGRGGIKKKEWPW